MSQNHANSYYEPHGRWWHCSALIDGKLIIYGGNQLGTCADGHIDLNAVYQFDIATEKWKQLLTSGTPPQAFRGVVCTAVKSFVYFFGGDEAGRNFSNELYCLDTSARKWSQLTPVNPESSPMAKSWASIVTHTDSILVTFGGFGILPVSIHRGVQYVQHPFSGRFGNVGWTNELVCYHIEQSKFA